MLNLAEYRRPTARLADFLPWAALVDGASSSTRMASFQRTANFRGPDLDSAVPAELVGVAGAAQQRAAAPRLRLGRLRRGAAPSRQQLSRRPFPGRRIRPGRCRTARGIRGGRRPHYESNYFLTFLYLPPAEEAARAERFLYEGRERDEGADAREVLRGFVDRTDRVLAARRGLHARDRLAR